MKRHALTIETRDVKRPETAREELLGGGDMNVPCLRIYEGNGVRWMYKSKDIIGYLERRIVAG